MTTRSLAPERTLPSNDALAAELGDHWTYRRLRDFTHGFYALDRCGATIVMSDLRMGVEPAYVFAFEIARLEDGRWRELRPATAVGERGSDAAADVFAWMGARMRGEASALQTDPYALIARASCDGLHAAQAATR